MKNLNESLKDNEEGEELKDIFLENDLEEESNPNTKYNKTQKLELKMKSYNKTRKSLFEKWYKKNKIKKLYIFIIIVLVISALLALAFLKYLSEIPSKVEKITNANDTLMGKVISRIYFRI